MYKRISYLFIVVVVTLVLSACSSIQLPGASATPEAAQANQPGQPGQSPDFGNMPVSGKLALGTLMLEDTANAVTAEQAAELLPLWKAVKSLSASENASIEEINALYEQIEETMTAEQVKAIQDMSMKPEDTQALMEKYGIKMQQMPTMDANRLATRQAQSGSGRSGQNGQGDQGGGFPGGEMPRGGVPGGGMPSGGVPGGDMPGGWQMPDAQNAQGTPHARPGGLGGMRGGGMNTMFVEPLITLLTERAGA